MNTETAVKTTKAQCIRAIWAVAAVFALNGMGIAAWASRIPAVKVELNLTPGQLGIILACSTVGSISGLFFAGRISAAIGLTRQVLVSTCIFAFGVTVFGMGADILHSQIITGVGLMIAGFGTGSSDVSLNIEGAHVEQLMSRSIMPRLHGAFSAGTVIMTLIAIGIVYFHIPVWIHLGALGLIWPILGYRFVKGFLPEVNSSKPTHTEHTVTQGSVWVEKRTICLGLMVLIFGLMEGIGTDWIPVAIVEGHHVRQWAGVALLSVFLISITTGRFFGNLVLDRLGRITTLRIMTLLAITGTVLFVFGSLWIAIIGALLWGVGSCLGFPVGMSAAADDPHRAAARVSAVGIIAYTSFLGGPPLIGFVADRVGILNSITVITALAVIALFLIPAAKPLPSSKTSPTL